jgi:hypothetical protein
VIRPGFRINEDLDDRDHEHETEWGEARSQPDHKQDREGELLISRKIGSDIRRQDGHLILFAERKNVVSLIWPSTLVWAERQNTFATASRATRATML